MGSCCARMRVSSSRFAPERHPGGVVQPSGSRSAVALAAFLAVGDRWPEVRLVRLRYAVPGLFLFLHLLAFVGILTFRRYIGAASRRVEEIVAEVGGAGRSPIPVGFCKWMTDLMAA